MKSQEISLCLIPGVMCDEALFEETIYRIGSARSIEEAALSLDATIDRPSFILGFSLGGWVAQEYAYRYPHKTKGLVLITTTKDTVLPATKKAMQVACEKLENFPLDEVLNSLISDYFDQSIEKKITEKYRKMAESACVSTAISQYQMIINQNEPVGGSACSHVSTLILHGNSDKRISFEEQKKLNHHFLNSTLMSVPNAGHFLPLERPKLLASMINDYLINA